MAENKVTEVTQDLIQSLRESNRAVVESAVAAQERNVKFAQSTIENGIELLKSHVESTRSVAQELSKQQQQAVQTIADSAFEAQERNIQFAQGVLENGIEVLKSQAESTRSLTHTLIEQSHQRRELYRTLVQESAEAYWKFLFAPLTYVERAFEITETITRQSAESFQKVANQAREYGQKVTS